MKLIIQIPCYNEAETLPLTIRDLPRTIKGFDSVELMVIDDGSKDGTAQVAMDLGVEHVLRWQHNHGLAYAFSRGLETALRLGADVIVNTDGDNQYQGKGVTQLVNPILRGEAEIVVGDRRVEKIAHFSRSKKLLQKVGSWIVRWASGTDIPDATSGFRAFSREAALQMTIYSNFSYTLETIIQAGKKGIDITYVPVETNPKLRESRLMRNIFQYVVSSGVTILRIFLMYEALRVFITTGTVLFGLGTLISLRFLYYFLLSEGQGHIQSLILAAVLLVLGFQTILLGLLADLIAKNRRLNEEASYRLKRLELGSKEIVSSTMEIISEGRE